MHLGMGGNCEKDESILLSNLHTFLNMKKVPEGENADRNNIERITGSQLENQDISQEIADAVNIGQTQTLSVAYVGGFIILEQTNCAECSKHLLGSSDAPHNLFIGLKEWSDVTEKLIYPAEHPVVAVGCGITLLEEFLEKNCTNSNLS